MTKIIRSLRSGQITIPSEFREKLGIDPDTLLQINLMNGELIIKPVKTTNISSGSPWLKELYDYFAPARSEAIKKGYTEKEINETIDQAIKAVRQEHVKSSV